LYGDTLDERISNLTIARMQALIAARSVQAVGNTPSIRDPETGWLRPEIVAEAIEMTVPLPDRQPCDPDIKVMPDGQWATSADADALHDLAEQAHRTAVQQDARKAFA